jgi:integrase
MSQVYQRGSLRRVRRASGNDVWEWRYRVKGKMRQEKYPVATYLTEKAMLRHLETAIKLLNAGAEKPIPVAATMGVLIQRYRKDYLGGLAKSTRNTDGSMLKVHIEPKWGDTAVSDLEAGDVDAWIKELKMSQSSKGRARRLLKQLIDKAMLWKYIPLGVNPMTLVHVKDSTKRVKKIVMLTPKQVETLIDALEEPYNLMVYIAASLGLRVEEIVALQWDDLDFKDKTLTIQRAYTHAELGDANSIASAATLPITTALAKTLQAYWPRVKSIWLFPSDRTGGPRSADMILKNYIRPAAKQLKLPHIGWHSFRHAYRSWIGGGKATMGQQKDMMRHADISTTAGYSGTPVEEMRPLVEAIAQKLRPRIST